MFPYHGGTEDLLSLSVFSVFSRRRAKMFPDYGGSPVSLRALRVSVFL